MAFVPFEGALSKTLKGRDSSRPPGSPFPGRCNVFAFLRCDFLARSPGFVPVVSALWRSGGSTFNGPEDVPDD